MDKVLYPNRSSDLISFFKITPDYPVPKKKKKPIREVTINDGLHMNADVPHSPSITNLLVELLKEYQRLYVTPWSAIRSIYPTVLKHTPKRGVKYDMKAIPRRRASLDDILFLPRTANEKAEWSRSECLDRLKGSPDVKGSREGMRKGMPLRAKGRRDSHFAQLSNGECLPVLSSCFWTKGGWKHYVDDRLDPEEPRTRKFIQSLQTGGRAILAHAERDPDGRVTSPRSYIAVFQIDNVRVDSGNLHLDITRREQSLQ
jgi:hypothetical protein